MRRTAAELGGPEILLNNVATQTPVDDFSKLPTDQWEQTFRVNVFTCPWKARAAVEHLPDGGLIIQTASIFST